MRAISRSVVSISVPSSTTVQTPLMLGPCSLGGLARALRARGGGGCGAGLSCGRAAGAAWGGLGLVAGCMAEVGEGLFAAVGGADGLQVVAEGGVVAGVVAVETARVLPFGELASEVGVFRAQCCQVR